MKNERRICWKIIIFLLTVFFLGGLILPAIAQTTVREKSIVRVGADIVVEADEIIKGDVVAIGGSVRVAGIVSGDVTAIGGDVFLESTAQIDGEVVAVGGTVRRAPGAIVEGSVTEVGGRLFRRWSRFFPFVGEGMVGTLFGLTLIMKILTASGMIIISLIVVALWPQQVDVVGGMILKDWVKTGVTGLITVIGAPVVLVLVALTIVGIPLALAIGFFLMVAGCMGFAAVSFLIGERMLKSTMVIVTLLGAVVLSLVRFVPFLGITLFSIASLFGLGSVLVTKFGTNRPWFRRAPTSPESPAAASGPPK